MILSDPQLKTIVRLFSLFASIDPNIEHQEVTRVIESYLKKYSRYESLSQYISIYQFYIDQHAQKKTKNQLKKISINAVKTIRLIDQLEKELHKKQQFILLIAFLEILRTKESILPDEEDFIDTLSLTFTLPDHEVDHLKTFILGTKENHKEANCILRVDGDTSAKGSENHLYRENLKGNVRIIRVTSINTFFFYYEGEEQLFLNDRYIIPGKIYELSKGQHISSLKVGLHSLKFKPIYYTEIGIHFAHLQNDYKLHFQIKELSLSRTDGSVAIHPFSFETQAFLLVGIIGSSGVGKTTLMDLISGARESTSGQVLINGYDIKNDRKKLQGLIGYVPQEDLLYEELTVYNNLYLQAKLSFDNLTQEEIDSKVISLLHTLDLYHIKDLKIGSKGNKVISGGQRKRLNIGLELMREPAVLLVDEPTSGLSSVDSLNILNLLREQTMQGRLVIINIHQPSAKLFKLLDQLIILDEGGYVVYTGDPMDSLVYFKTINEQVDAGDRECPVCGAVEPDILLEIIEQPDPQNKFGRKYTPQQWNQMFRDNLQQEVIPPEKQKLPKAKFKLPGAFYQFGIYFRRNILTKLANKQYLMISLLEAPLLALILAYFTRYNAGTPENPAAYIFSKNLNLPAFLLMSIIVALFLGMLVSSEEIFKDKPKLKQEKLFGLKIIPYLHSKIIYLFILSAIQIFSFVLVGNSILGIEGMYFSYWLILFSAACFSNLLGLLLSSSMKSVIAIYIAIPFVLIPQILFSGTIVEFDKLNSHFSNRYYPPIFADLMASRWAQEALAVKQFKNNPYEKHFFTIDQLESDAAYHLNALLPQLEEDIAVLIQNRPGAEKEKRAALLVNSFRNLNLLIPEALNKMPLKIKESDIRSLQNQIDSLEAAYSRALDRIMYRKDEISQRINQEADISITRFKQHHHNEAIADLVKQSDDRDKLMISSDNEYMRTAEPVFFISDHVAGRSHFYAPRKKIAKNEINTLYFNTFAIWLLSFFVYLVLIRRILRI